MKEGRFAEALRAFTQAHRVAPSRRTVAEKGMAEQALHLWVNAEGHLTIALEDADDVWVKSNRVLLEEALHDVRSHIGTVSLDVRPIAPSLRLTAAGEWIPWAGPGTLRLPEGEIVLEARAPGFAPWRRTVVVRSGTTIEIPVQLAPLPAPLVRAPMVNEAAAPAGDGAPAWLSAGLVVAGAGSLAYGTYLLSADGQRAAGCAASDPCPLVNANRTAGMLLVGGGTAVALAGVILAFWQPHAGGSSSGVALGPGTFRLAF